MLSDRGARVRARRIRPRGGARHDYKIIVIVVKKLKLYKELLVLLRFARAGCLRWPSESSRCITVSLQAFRIVSLHTHITRGLPNRVMAFRNAAEPSECRLRTGFPAPNHLTA